MGKPPRMVWHRDSELPEVDLIVLPGGFSYGDYLRCGAMAAHSPVMREVKARAEAGVAVLGICNGFQILTEAGLLPGVLLRNAGLDFVCRNVGLEVETSQSLFTRAMRPGQTVSIPVAHHDGNYFADAATLDRLEERGRVAFRYCDAEGELKPEANPNGSARAYRRHLQREQECAGPDAASRECGRGAARRDGRARAVRGLWSEALVVNKPLAAEPAITPAYRRRAWADRRGISAHPGDPGPRAQPDRARHLLGDVERALLLQILAQMAAEPADQGAGGDPGPGRECRGRRYRRRRRRHLQDREPQPSLASSSPIRARRPASAASCATSSPWARGRSPC